MDCSELAQLKIAKITKCINVGGYLRSSPASYDSSVKNNRHRYDYREPTRKELYDYAMKQLAESRATDEKTHAANALGLITNKIIAQNIESFMKSIGMPSTYQEVDQKSRARTTKYISKSAGYVEDISRQIVLNDGYDYNVTQYEMYEKSYKEFYEKALKEEEESKKKIELEEKKKIEERRANLEIATLILRYSLPEDSDWETIYDVLLDRNQRIRLAMAMIDVRNDWNDGAGPVENALRGYETDNLVDKEIYENVTSTIDNWDNDGRAFRDCEYNYDVILGLVEDKQLLADVILAQSRMPDRY